MSKNKSDFENELIKADANEVVPDAEFVVMGELVIATCPACSHREEISLSDFQDLDSIEKLEILCSECDVRFSLPDLTDLIKLK